METQKWYKNNRKIFLLSALATVLVVAAVSIAVVKSHEDDAAHHGGEAVVRSTCAATLYPELCFSTIKEAAADSKLTKKDVLITALNYAIRIVQRNYFTVKKIGADGTLTPREKVALHDCLEMIDDTLAELRGCQSNLRGYGLKNYTLADHKGYLITFFSAAQTNQETCLDGFSHDEAEKKVRKALIAGQIHIFRLVSNVLAILKNLADAEMGKSSNSSPGRKLREEIGHADGEEWPDWLSAGDRRLLQARSVTPDVTVAADGSGNYRTVSAAVAAAPSGRSSTSRYVIMVCRNGRNGRNVTGTEASVPLFRFGTVAYLERRSGGL